jgi:serine/threonine-protein kinase
VLRELRRDRASVVYLASDPVMHREVILKTVEMPPPAHQRDSIEADISPLEKAFVRQAQAAGKLQHPHIVTVFDAGRVHQTGYLAIERVHGRPLHELIVTGFRPEFVHCASIGARIADAIDYAHGQGLAHGHLGPQHVILQNDGAPKVEGFGGWIDGGRGGEDALHRTERLLPYFGNEVSDQDRRGDVRAIAGLLYMMLTGKAAGTEVLPVQVHRPEVPDALARIIDETLSAAPEAARRTAGDLRDALTAFIWNARKENVAPATIGIPLAAPPETPPPDGLAATQIEARPPPDALLAPTRPAPKAPPATLRIDGAPSTRPAGRAESRPAAAARRTRPAAPAAEGPTSLAEVLRMLWTQSRPWLRKNRLVVGAVTGLIAAGVVIGVVLGLTAGSRTPGPAETVEVAVAPTAPQPVRNGLLKLDIAPWGEVFVDGKPIGVSPPLTEIPLTAGRHQIEIRYGDKGAVAAQVTVDPDQPLQIRHRFE